MPYKITDLAGKPYRPSNGTEGLKFQEQHCAHCRHYDERAEDECGDCMVRDADGSGLSLLARSFWSDIGDDDYPKEWVHDAEGCPTCTVFEMKKEG